MADVKCEFNMDCDNDPVETEIGELSVADLMITNALGPDSVVTCGRCKKLMLLKEYDLQHRKVHYNLCWLDEMENEIDFTDTSEIIEKLRTYFKKIKKKTGFKCDICNETKQTIAGLGHHLQKCSLLVSHQPVDKCNVNEVLNSVQSSVIKHNSDSVVICGRCNKSMIYTEYEKIHKKSHYYLCWLIGDEELNFDDEDVVRNLLKQCLPANFAKKKKKVNFTCDWCRTEKKSVVGFASHIKQCQLRPDKNDSITNSTIPEAVEIPERDDKSMVTCGRCNTEMTFKEYRTNHCSKHYNLCWIHGEVKLDLTNYDDVLSKLKQSIPFKVVRNRSVKLICEKCKTLKKSIIGFASHVVFCYKHPSDTESLLVTCEDCGAKVKPSSSKSHKKNNCKASSNAIDGIKINYNFNKLRRKKRPPNVLSFHPDTKYVTEYYDWACRLCDFITLNVNEIISHLLQVHDVDIYRVNRLNINENRKIANTQINLEDIILNTYDTTNNISLKPLLNYYNFFKRTFWTYVHHEDFPINITLLKQNEALKYLPCVQQSCKIFSSNNESIYVDLFNSAHVNGMYWLFTGGPNWAMSWCPVPEDVQTQYLAIACHPKPDMEHKEMNAYKYPSILQLWTFYSLNNINYETVSSMPCMSYGLAHEFGAVWDMAWCPSGAYEPNKKIGLLALSTSCGDCPIFAMPHLINNLEKHSIYKAKPVIARNFECEWLENVQCVHVCWQAVSPFNNIICGYSNGTVSVFHINFESIFLKDDIFYPSHTFRASKCCITGLSMNYLNPSILATTASDGYVSLWDVKSTENPVFQKKFYSPSGCAWLQQCYTLTHISKGFNPTFLKVRTINFTNFDDDVMGYNPELYILKNVVDTSIEISDFNVVNNDSKSLIGTDDTIDVDRTNINNDEEINANSSDEDKLNNSLKPGDYLKNIDDEDLYGPSFYQNSIHWSISGSNWMNVIATGDENGIIYEKQFLPETNQLRKENAITLKLEVKKLLPSDDTPQSEYKNCFLFNNTVKEFVLESKFFTNEEFIPNNPDDSQPLLRYPLDNITKVSWNQNFSSFRWLAIGSQSGFTLISPSQTISNECLELFYKTISTSDISNVKVETNNPSDVS